MLYIIKNKGIELVTTVFFLGGGGVLILGLLHTVQAGQC